MIAWQLPVSAAASRLVEEIARPSSPPVCFLHIPGAKRSSARPSAERM